MENRESSRSYKRDVEERSDMKGDRVGDEEEWDSSEKRKYRAGSGDEDDYDTRKELRSKQLKKNQEEKKHSSDYQERESESYRKGRDISGSKGDDSERESSRKSSSKPLVLESSQSKSRSKLSSSHDADQEKTKDKDSRYSERKESSRDKGHGTREAEKNLKRYESDSVRKGEENSYVEKSDSRTGKASDVKHGTVRERLPDLRNESNETKARVVDSNSDTPVKSSNGGEKRIDEENSKSRDRSEALEEDNRLGSISREERSSRDDKLRTVQDKPSGIFEDIDSNAHKTSTRGHGEKTETHRHLSDPAYGIHDIADSRERSINTDEDGRARTMDRTERSQALQKVLEPWEGWEAPSTVRNNERSLSLKEKEREKDNYRDSDRSISLKEKEREKDSYRDDRSKGHDNSWSDRNKDREGSKDNWRRRYQGGNDKDSAYVDVNIDYENGWDSRRRDRERIDNDKVHFNPGYRRTGRNDGSKTSSSYGNANRSSEMIEIRPTSIDYGRDESGSILTGRKTEGGPQTDHTSATSDEQWGNLPDDRSRMTDVFGPADDLQERYPDDGFSVLDQNSGRNNLDMEKGRGQKGVVGANRSGGGPSPRSASQLPFGNNQGSGNFSRSTQQGAKGSRLGRGGRGRVQGRDAQRVGIQLPMMGPPFGHLGLPPGHMQALGPNMSPGPGPPIGLGVFIPQFSNPNVWPGARGIDMNMLAGPPGPSPVPPGPSPSRFPPNVLTGPNPSMYFNQQSSVIGVSPGISGPGFNAMGTMGRGMPNEKALGGWSAPRITGPPGKAPSRGEQNDYSQHFVDTGSRPQNFIRELELTSVVEDYPKLRELIQKKDEIVSKVATPPMYYKCDLREFVLSPEFFGTKFDVILVDPPWEEYVHRAPGVADLTEYWTFEQISNLKIEAIADTPSFIFLWVGDGVGLEQGRQCLRKWGFRRCEDICWVKTNKGNAAPGLRHDSHTLFQHSKEHCLMGIKGTVRRSTDGHIIHANIDTDIIIAEEPPYGSSKKPEDMYRIIEHFSLGRRRLELFGEDHNIRSGWLTVGKGLSSSNFNAEGYIRNFCDKDGKVWQGGGGRNPPPEAPHLVLTTPDIEGLRPKSPIQKNQQQPQSSSLSQTTVASVNKRPAATSPQNRTILSLNQEGSSSNASMPVQWTSPMVGIKTPDTVNVVRDDKSFDGYGYEPSGGQAIGDQLNFASQGASNLL
ncbi:hypothetical protein IFM89_015449 [Coptis chinensis]|uniref:Methyltransferase-like protein 1 n=1 Tax=Coptis chinensis TaxID=261450 RepID=A0A835I9T6_9MAGN|nr:hypothetical protein IFM89_015449 [Coptis chinensis]